MPLRNGLDRLAQGECPGLIRGRVALVCNHTAVDGKGRHAVEVLRSLPSVELCRLLGPEHGLWSTHQDMEAVVGGYDEVFQLPVTSLYGDSLETLSPTHAALEDIDTIVYDVRDIGCRFYTYAATLALTMEVAAARGIPVWVLDRPNPIGSLREGPLLEDGFTSFCGIEPGIPIRHGMAMGELAHWLRHRRAPTCELHVIDFQGDPQEDDLRWVPPSPNMPTLDTAFVYPGMCLLEGTSLSEGRGTTTPFLLFGAPGVDPLALTDTLNALGLPGVDFIPRCFRPEFQKHAGRLCGGSYIRVHDRHAIRAVELGVWVLAAIRQHAPEALRWRRDTYEFVSKVPAIDLLWGNRELRETLDNATESVANLHDRVRSLIRSANRQASAWTP